MTPTGGRDLGAGADLRQAAGTATTRDDRRLGEDAFGGHLPEGRRLPDARSDSVDDSPTGLPDEFEALRWPFLPPARLAG